MKLIKKVTAFITRGVSDEADLLLFVHPDAGIQLPAGTVELAEKPEDAVIRETGEETGLTTLDIINLLGRQSYALPQGEMAILRMTKLFDEPTNDSSSGGLALTRGSSVGVKGVVGEFSLVFGDALQIEQSGEKRVKKAEGYVRTTLLTNRMIRYFFHLNCIDSNQDQWNVSADGHLFKCFWTPLRRAAALNQAQQTWLNDYYEELVDSLNLHSGG